VVAFFEINVVWFLDCLSSQLFESMLMNPGDKVRKEANPSRVVVVTGETSGNSLLLRHLMVFPDGDEFRPSLLKK
jgi:hypothetical protein